MTYLVPQTLEDIHEMQERGDAEGATLEFKSSRLFEQKNEKVFEALSRELTAFANSIGGVLIVGIEEDSKDRSISSINPIADGKKDGSWVEDGLLSRISPSLNMSIEKIEVDNGHLLVINVPPSRNAPHQSADKRYYARRVFRVDQLLDFEIDDIRRRAIAIEGGASLSLAFQGGGISFSIKNEGLRPIFNIWIEIKGIENTVIAKAWTPGLGRPYTEPFRIIHGGEERNFLGAGFELFKEHLRDRMEITLHYHDEDEKRHQKNYVYYLKDFENTVRFRTQQEELLEQGVKSFEKLNDTLSGLARDLHVIREFGFHPSGLNLSKTTLSTISGEKQVKWPGGALTFQGLAEVLDVDIETALNIQRSVFGESHYVGGKNLPLDEVDLSEEIKDKIRSRLSLPPTDLEK